MSNYELLMVILAIGALIVAVCGCAYRLSCLKHYEERAPA